MPLKNDRTRMTAYCYLYNELLYISTKVYPNRRSVSNVFL